MVWALWPIQWFNSATKWCKIKNSIFAQVVLCRKLNDYIGCTYLRYPFAIGGHDWNLMFFGVMASHEVEDTMR